ncbi:uncharacterized protein LOC142750394 [Rhinoderma darwinii]|uniref:uncharacterized protein LOC142750394 n=1 Tax=Rhinoderma darwinii TaxID=43563 RepID=UPI003F663935
MDMEVSALINLVHNRPEIWDTSIAAYSDRNAHEEGWTYVCRGLYPEWDGMLEREQGVIENDVRNRWRTVRDRFQKQLSKTPASGSSPSRCATIAHFEELSFLIPCRELRRSQGNVPPRPPQVSALAQAQQQPLGASSANVVGDMTEEDVSHESTPAPAVPRDHTSPAPPAGPSRPRQRVGGRKRVAPPETSNTVEGEALTMIRRVEAEDEYHNFGYSIAGRCRGMETTRRAAYMTCAYALADIFEAPQPLPDVADIIFTCAR